jgi:FkbM family methyltransferase
MLKQVLKKSILGYSHYSTSFSIGAEDLVLMHVLSDVKDGFYVDVGAFHPEKHSNTFLLHKYGWRGINIDAMPGVIDLFKKARPDDINLEIGITSQLGSMDFYVSKNNTLFNSFDSSFQQNLLSQDVTKITVNTKPLSMVFDESLPQQGEIDLLLIDVEGFELVVLQSNDWDRYRPRIILIEDFTCFVDEIFDNPCVSFLKEKGYRVLHKIPNGIIFSENNNKFSKFNRLIP